MKPFVRGPWAKGIAASLGCYLLFTAIAWPASAGDAPVRAERTVKVGVLGSFPPYYQLDEDGNPSGFAVAIMDAVAKRAGLKVTYHVAENWGANFEVLRTGKIDIIPSLGISDDRKQHFSFTHPVDTFRIALFVRDDTVDVAGIDDLKGRPIAVVVDNLALQHLEKRTDIFLRVFPKFTDALFALLSAEVDAFAYPEPVAWKLAREARVTDRIKVAAEPLFEIKRAMAVRKDNTALLAVLNRAIRDFVASPEYQQVYVAWFGKPDPYWTVARVVWVMGGSMAVLLLSMVWWRYRVGVQKIQELQKSEQRLRESENLFYSIIENVPVGLLLKDSNQIVERANSTYLSWYGFDADTMVGRRSDEIEDFQSINEAEIMNAQEREVLDTGQTRTRLVERPFADGRVHTVSITKFPVYDQQGNITKVGSASVDLTEQVEARKALAHSEVRFRDFAESASDWLWETDERLRFTYISDRYREVAGFDPASYLGKTRREIAEEDTNDDKWRRHDGDLENRRPFRDFRYRLKTVSGGRLVVSISGKPNFDESGKFLGYRGTGTNITEQILAQDARARAQQEAEKANRAKSEFIATMSHDLRTPLNVILGLAEMMSRAYHGPIDEKYREYAEAIRSSGAILLSLVNEILDLSAIESGHRSISKQHVNIRDAFSDCEKIIAARACQEGVMLTMQVPDEGGTVYADRQALNQILLNILTNAVKFTPRGGKVTVSSTTANEETRIIIADTGKGVPSDDLARLTEPFVRGQSDPYTSSDGWGLGLSIVKSLIKLHGGGLTIESEVGIGTTVTVSLPN